MPDRKLRRYQRVVEDRKAGVDWSEFDTKESRRSARREAKAEKISTGVERLRDIALNPRPTPMSPDERQRLADIRTAAERISTGVETMKGAVVGAINAIPPPRVSVTVPVRTYINGRLLEASLSQYTPSHKRGQQEF
jgi:hypothetical protein